MNRAPAARAQAKRTLWIAAIASFAVYGLFYGFPASRPFVAELLWLSTASHSLGHSLASLPVCAAFDSAASHSADVGAALRRAGCHSVEGAWLMLGGFVAPLLFAWGLFLAARRQGPAQATLCVLFFAVLLIASAAENLAGLGLLLAAALFVRYVWRAAPKTVLAVIALQLCLWNFLGIADGLVSDAAFRNSGLGSERAFYSDTQQLAEALGLTSNLWGAFVALVSLASAWFGARLFLNAVREPNEAEVEPLSAMQKLAQLRDGLGLQLLAGTARQREMRMFWLATALTLGVYGLFWLVSAETLLSVIAVPLTGLSLLSHNAGHFLMAKLLSADYGYASIHSEDVALTLHRAACCAPEQSTLILAGLLMPSLTAFALFAAARRPTLAKWLIYGLTVLCFLVLLKAMGYLGLLFFGALYFSYRAIDRRYGRSLVLAVIAMQLCLWNAFSFDALFGHKDEAIDLAQLAQALELTYRLCAALPVIFSLAALWLGSRYYLRPHRSPRA